MNRILYLLFASLLFGSLAFADTNGTKTVTVQSSGSTKVLDANDVVGGRHYLLIQNIGSVTVNCTIGVSAGATTSTGNQLIAAGSLFVPGVQGTNGVFFGPPNGEIDCIAASSTSPVTVISY